MLKLIDDLFLFRFLRNRYSLDVIEHRRERRVADDRLNFWKVKDGFTARRVFEVCYICSLLDHTFAVLRLLAEDLVNLFDVGSEQFFYLLME